MSDIIQLKEKRNERISIKCTKKTKQRLVILCKWYNESEGDIFSDFINATYSTGIKESTKFRKFIEEDKK